MTFTILEPNWSDLLQQTEYWTTRSPDWLLVRVRVDDMDDDHRRRVLALLRDHAEDLHARELRSFIHPLLVDTVSGAAESARRLRELQAVAPAVWLDDSPLVRRLVALTPHPAHAATTTPTAALETPMTAKPKKRRGRPGQTREQALRAWAAAGPARDDAARTEQRIEIAQDWREYAHRDPWTLDHIDRVQDAYERYTLGWGAAS